MSTPTRLRIKKLPQAPKKPKTRTRTLSTIVEEGDYDEYAPGLSKEIQGKIMEAFGVPGSWVETWKVVPLWHTWWTGEYNTVRLERYFVPNRLTKNAT